MTATDDGTLLLAAILAQPDEDTPRLAYADWLDEQEKPAGCRAGCRRSTNGPWVTWQQTPKGGRYKPCRVCKGSGRVLGASARRAELIRAQIGRDRYMEPFGPRSAIVLYHEQQFKRGAKCEMVKCKFCEHKRRAEAALDRLGLCDERARAMGVPESFNTTDCPETAPFPGGPWEGLAVVRRGFVAEVRCPLAAWVAHGSAIVKAHPVTTVRLVDRVANQYESRPPECGWYFVDNLRMPYDLPVAWREGVPSFTWASFADQHGANAYLSDLAVDWAKSAPAPSHSAA